jgi:hypothetical protein
MLQQQRFRSDGTHATGAQEFHEGDQQVDGEDEEFAHGTNRIKTASARKTAPRWRIPSYYEFATDRFESTADVARRLIAVTNSPKRSIIAFRCRHAPRASRVSAGHGLELALPTVSRLAALRTTDQKPDGQQGTDPLKPELKPDRHRGCASERLRYTMPR